MRELSAIGLAMLMLLSACSETPDVAAIDHNATLIRDSLEREADNLEAIANNTADPAAAAAIDNAADRLEGQKANVSEAADAAKAARPR